MNSKFTIGNKLMLCFGVVLALILGLAYSSLSSLGDIGTELDTSVNKTVRKTEMIYQMQKAVSDMRAGQRGMILFGMLKDPRKSEMAKDNFRRASTAVEKLSAEIRPLLVTDVGRRSAETIQSRVAMWLPLYREIEAACGAQRYDAAMTSAMDRTVALAGEMEKAAEELLQVQRGLLTSASRNAAATSSTARNIAIALIVLCLIMGCVVVWVVRDVSGSLRRMAGEMAEGAVQVASAASQVSGSSQSLAQGSSEQAASLEETSASSEEINATSHKNSENSRLAADLVTHAQNQFAETNRALDQMVVSIEEINSQSDKISKIMKVIDEIAFQTNILALNAAVEAARAGEAGMGFAVVADEVRNLAQRCAQAARDTASLIEESISKSHDGKAKVDQMAISIRAVTEESAKVKTLIDEVNVGSQEQVRGIEQISKAIAQMEQVTQKTAAHAEESASAAEELNAQSEALKDIVGRLAAMVGGSDSGSYARRA